MRSVFLRLALANWRNSDAIVLEFVEANIFPFNP